jgi:hypothetical protein
MANSLAKRHFQRASAAAAAGVAAATAGPVMTMEGANAYELQLAKLQQDYLRLKQVQSEEGKAELKRQLLPEHAPYIEGVLSADKGAQDQVVTTVMVWRIDAGDYPGALDIAAYVIRHGLIMPDRFVRTTGCIVAEEIADAALKAQKAGGAFELDLLNRTAAITAEEDMPDQVRAKLNLAIGKAYSAQVGDDTPTEQAQPTLELAKQHLARAIELNSNCGGKKDLERVDRLVKKHAATGS